MIFRSTLIAAFVLCAGQVAAQTNTTTAGPATTSATAPSSGISASSKLPPVTQLLQQGFEVKAGFMDASGSAYLVLQNKTSAYLCHSGAVAACDKLN